MSNFIYGEFYDGYKATNSDKFPYHIDKEEFHLLGNFLLNVRIIDALYYESGSNYIEFRLVNDNPVLCIDNKDEGTVFTYIYMVFNTNEEASDKFEYLINKLDRGMS